MENKYRHRTATTEGTCFVCSKLTSAVFQSSSDFFFVCLTHIRDSSFCRKIIEETEQVPEKIGEEKKIEKAKAVPKTDAKTDKKSDKKPVEIKEDKEKEESSKNKIDDEGESIPDSPDSASQDIKQSMPAIQYFKICSQFMYLRERHYKQIAAAKKKRELLESLRNI